MYTLQNLATLASDIEQLINEQGYDGNMSVDDVNKVKEIMFNQLGDDLGYQLNVGEIEPAQSTAIDYVTGEVEQPETKTMERMEGYVSPLLGRETSEEAKAAQSATLRKLYARGKIDCLGTELEIGDWVYMEGGEGLYKIITETPKMFRVRRKYGHGGSVLAAPWTLTKFNES